MEEKFTKLEQRVMDLFFRHPKRQFSIRDIARIVDISHPSASGALKKLYKKGIVHTQPGHPVIERRLRQVISKKHPTWCADTNSASYRVSKQVHNLRELLFCGIVEEISKRTSPNAIILFGSYSRGEDIADSDIDLLVISSKQPLPLKKYEKKLGRKINILFEPDPSRLRKELLNNLVNGIVVYGYFEAFK